MLSRVTIGADIAITSIVCQRLRSRFPDAEIVLIGSGKLRQLFAEGSGVRVAELAYTRRGGLLERFNAWLALLALVRQETAGMPEDGYLVLDPDSRLTQLGVLPLVDDSRYRFFNSRSRPEDPATASMSELANLWLDRTLQTNDFCYPKVWLPEAEQARAQELLQGARAAGRRIIALNLGVGGNERKRVSNAFERELALNLLADPANLVLLDLGFGATEVRRSRAILRAAQQAGIKVGIGGFADLSQRLVDGGHRLPAGSAGGLATRGQFAKDTRLPAGSAGGLMTLGQLAEDTRLLGVESTMAEVGALIACSDEFIGYDSACQHLAAALGVPTYTIFAGATNPRFVRRWHAFGPAKNEIVFVDTVSRDPPPDPQEIIARLEDLRRD